MISRRAFVGSLTGSLLAAPLAAEAQQAGKVWRIGILNPTTPPAVLSVFGNRLADLGYVEGRTVEFESRNAEGRPERLPALAAELVRLKVDVLVTLGSQATRAATQATTTIPIMFLGVASPVEAGIVASLAHPGGNVTGATDQTGDLGGKELQLITEIVPKRTRIGVLGDSANPGSIRMQQMLDQQAQQLGLALNRIDVRKPEDLDAAFATLSRHHAGALIVAPTPALVQTRDRVATLAIQNRLPPIAYTRSMVEAGVLMSYGTSWPDLAKRAAEYVDRILRGTQPAGLPVVQPTKFELVINLKTAKALGLTIPPSLLARADQVIE